jgi:hypothetical protein
VVSRYFFKVGALVWRLFLKLQKSSIRSALLLLAKAAPRLCENQKTPARLLKNSRLRVVRGGLDTVQSRDKLAFWSGIKSGLFFKADSGGRGEY